MRISFFALLIMSVCQLGVAQESAETTKAGIYCDGITPVDSPNFEKLAEASAAINRNFCSALFKPLGGGSRAELQAYEAEWRKILLSFAETSRSQALRIAEVVSIENFDRPFAQLREKLNQGDVNSMSLPGFSVDRDIDGSVLFHFQDRAESARIRMGDNEACVAQFEKTCDALLQEYDQAFTQYKSAYTKITAGRTLDQIDDLSEDWRRFLQTARSQTLFDLGFNTRRESKHFQQGYLVGPPSRQWFFLHPSIVYEHLPEAPDGFETKPGIALEIVGVNYWQEEDSPLPIPFGVSLASSFVDRPDTDDVGVSLMLHFDNRYSFGVSQYDSGETGLYFTVDLLNAVNDKSKVFEAYKKSMFD